MNKKTIKTFLKKFLIFILVALLVLIILGFLFPGLIWTKSLGIRYTKQDYKNTINKINEDSTNEKTIELTSEEVTSLLNEKLNFCEMKNIQLRINDNDTLDISSKANLDCIIESVSGYSAGQVRSYIPEIALLPSNINFYITLSGSVIENQSYIYTKSIYIQGTKLPDNILNSSESKTMITKAINKMITDNNTTNGSSFNSITIDNNKLIIEGIIPSI